MSSVRLMNRTDTKYICSRENLEQLLEEAETAYMVQETGGEKILPYRTLYMDTEDLKMYHEHHHGRKPRFKVRIRTYVRPGLSFLEVKQKDNHGRTSKTRTPFTGLAENSGLSGNSGLIPEQQVWCKEQGLPFRSEELLPSLENEFNRITLVDKNRTERLTIDFDLKTRNPRTGKNICFTDLVIIELKRSARNSSVMSELLKNHRIKPASFSKYCIGTALTTPGLKQNNFKERIRNVRKYTAITEII